VTARPEPEATASQQPPAEGRRRRATVIGGTAVIVTVTALSIAGLVLRPESGILGLLQVLSPHFSIVALLAAPVALARGAWVARITLVILAMVTIVRFGDEWFSPGMAVPSERPALEILTWNLQLGARASDSTVAELVANPADVVVVQELQPAAAAAIEADASLRATYPHRALVPRDDVGGMGILSRLPLRDMTFRTGPVVQEAVVSVGGVDVRLVNVHPFPGAIQRLPVAGLPFGIDPAGRNADLVDIRSAVDQRIAAGERVLLLGDFNTAPTEPAYEALTRGLTDVHRLVGQGPGWTWRPARFAPLGIGLLRIDFILLGPGLAPAATAVTCPSTGDHCLVRARIALP
jgi:vancomycin resistance protein VanJ